MTFWQKYSKYSTGKRVYASVYMQVAVLHVCWYNFYGQQAQSRGLQGISTERNNNVLQLQSVCWKKTAFPRFYNSTDSCWDWEVLSSVMLVMRLPIHRTNSIA